MRVCQFRHFGKSDRYDPSQAVIRKELALIFYRRVAGCQTRSCSTHPIHPSSLALIVIFAFSTLETGQPLLAFSAAF